jgi:hypothetical protein
MAWKVKARKFMERHDMESEGKARKVKAWHVM